MNRLLNFVCLVAACLFMSLVPATARACPFCSAQSMTFAEEMANSDAAIIARLIVKPALPAADSGAPGALPPPPAKSTFEIVTVLKGEKLLEGKKKFEVLFFGQQEPGAEFLLFGIDPKELAWGTPTPLSEQSVKYLTALPKLPDAAIERLTFFQKYFEDPDPLLSSDAYNEYSKAPYTDIIALKDRMQREKLVAWIKDPNVPTSRRRLYLTMLGVCGQPADVALLEQMIKDEDRQTRTALDAMIGCYLNLKGADGLPLVEELFLKNEKADYVDTWSTIQALRFMGQETKVVPKEKLVAALRHMLNRPQLADLVIPDLARWQDWSAMDRLVQLFKEADDETSFVRVPVVQFLRQCPGPKAQEYLKELAKIDPDAVKRAMNFFPVASPAAPLAKTDGAAGDKPTGDLKAGDAKTGEAPAATGSAANAAITGPTVGAPTVGGLEKGKSAPPATPSAEPSSAVPPSASAPNPSAPVPSAEAAAPLPMPSTSIAKAASFDSPTRGGQSGDTKPQDEESLIVAQAEPSRTSPSPTPPINPPENGKMLLIGGLAVGGVLLLLLLVIVRGRREPTGS